MQYGVYLSQMITTETKSEVAPENVKAAANGAPGPLLFDIRTAAYKLSMSVVSIRKLIRQGRLKRLENFRKILIPASELERFANLAN